MKEQYIIAEQDGLKTLSGEDYNYIFNQETGYFSRWGATKEDDPRFSPCGPEIADIEISTACSGLDGIPCRFCYKSNGLKGSYMPFENFKTIFHNMPRTLTQIAFGIGDIDANPDIWDIFRYCRENEYNKVIPNVTINGAKLNPLILDRLAALCGAVAVSRYNPPDYCYNAVHELATIRKMPQVNIHMLLSKETYDDCLKVIDDAKTDERLKDLNAIVFLSLKPKGRGTSLTCLKDQKKYRRLIYYAFEKGVNIGFDSCSAPLFLKAVEDHKDYTLFKTLAEPCESYLFSIYIDVNGYTVPCSFLAGQEHAINLGIPDLELKDWWLAPTTKAWRERLLQTECNGLVEGCRQCPVFDIY